MGGWDGPVDVTSTDAPPLCTLLCVPLCGLCSCGVCLAVGVQAASGLCLVAVEEPTQEVVAFFLWEDMAASAWGEKLDISPKFEAQFRFMTELEQAYLDQRGVSELPRGDVMHGIYGGTRQSQTGKRVITTLMELSAQHAARKGFSRMVTEAVVLGSQFVSFKLGWRDVALKQYTNFVHKGALPFAGVPVAARAPCAVLFELNVSASGSKGCKENMSQRRRSNARTPVLASKL